MAKITMDKVDEVTLWKYRDRVMKQKPKRTGLNAEYHSTYYFKDDYYKTEPELSPHSNHSQARHCTVDGKVYCNMSLKEWTKAVGFIDEEYEA